jgi:hypothetical protein
MTKKPRPKQKPRASPLPPRPAAIALRTSYEVKEEAEQAARSEHRTLSQWVELLIIKALEERKKR